MEVVMRFVCPTCGQTTPPLHSPRAELVNDREARRPVYCFGCRQPVRNLMLVGEVRPGRKVG